MSGLDGLGREPTLDIRDHHAPGSSDSVGCGDVIRRRGSDSVLKKCRREGMTMDGPAILVRTMSVPSVVDEHGNTWQYHSRSDRHSKVACWVTMFDLLQHCALLRRHVAEGTVAFGVNHNSATSERGERRSWTWWCIALEPNWPVSERGAHSSTWLERWTYHLTGKRIRRLRELPDLRESAVGTVLMALEAKACMTKHRGSGPRLYDELNSSHITVHGAADQAIAVAFVMINGASTFVSPDSTGAR